MNTQTTSDITLASHMMAALNFVQAGAPIAVSAALEDATNIATAFNFQPPSYPPTEDIMARHNAYVPAFTVGVRSGFETRLREIVLAGNPIGGFLDEKLHEVRWPDMIDAGLVTFNMASGIVRSIEHQAIRGFDISFDALELRKTWMDIDMPFIIPPISTIVAYIFAAIGITKVAILFDPGTFNTTSTLAILMLCAWGAFDVKEQSKKRMRILTSLDNFRTIESRLLAPGYFESLDSVGHDSDDPDRRKGE